MATSTTAPDWKYPRHKGVTLTEKQGAMLAALKIIDSKESPPTEGILRKIAREYMFEEAGIVWPVWQALASKLITPKRVIRDLEQKQEWSLDILLVQHPHASEAFLHRMKNLREDIQGKNTSSKGFDNNKELREYACKRLGVDPDETTDE